MLVETLNRAQSINVVFMWSVIVTFSLLISAKLLVQPCFAPVKKLSGKIFPEPTYKCVEHDYKLKQMKLKSGLEASYAVWPRNGSSLLHSSTTIPNVYKYCISASLAT